VFACARNAPLNFSEKLLAARNVENHLFVHLFDQIAEADGRRPAGHRQKLVWMTFHAYSHTRIISATTFSTCTFLAGNVILFS
jgi:hypothetical protein